MNILTTAWKNMFRYKRRTIITAAAIATGVLFSLFMDGMLVGIDQESKVNLVAYETSAARIYAKGYFDEHETFPIDILIETEQGKKIETFLDNANVSAIYSPRYVTTCEIIFQEDFFEMSGSINAILYGVDPINDAKVYDIASSISEGEWFTRDSSGNASGNSLGFYGEEGLVIGSWIAEDMKAEIGYYVTVQVKGRGGFIQTMDVPITGIVQTANPTINRAAAYMDLAYLDEMLELEGAVTEYSINLGTVNVIDARYEKLAALSPEMPKGTELYAWQDIVADYIALTESKSGASDLMLLIIFIVAAVGITNTILMAVMERKNEIGMLRALGYSGGYIKRLFVSEGIYLGLLGVIAGIILSLPITFYMVEYGIDLTPIYGNMDIGYRITGIMRSAWNLQSYITISIGALFVSAISAAIPSGILLRKEIAEIFRKV